MYFNLLSFPQQIVMKLTSMKNLNLLEKYVRSMPNVGRWDNTSANAIDYCFLELFYFILMCTLSFSNIFSNINKL